MKKKLIGTIAIVDGASTSAYLAPAFRAYGIKCVHILSSKSLPERLKAQINLSDYIRNVVHQGNIRQTADLLRDLDIDVVLPGGGSGIELAAELADELGVPLRNSGKLAAARRHKYEQIEVLKRCGLHTPQQFLSGSISEVVDWARVNAKLPLVIKPTRGAGV